MDIFDQILHYTLGILEGRASAKKKYLDTGKIDKRFFNSMVEGDPSPTKKYVEWMIHIGIEEGWVNEIIIKVVRDFNRLAVKGYLKNSDIYSYKTLKDAKKAVADPKNREKLRQARKNRATDIVRVKETDKYLILFPKTYEAVKKYGAHTKWCITSSEEDWIDVVKAKRKYYFVIDKVNNRKYAVDSDRTVHDDQDDLFTEEDERVFFDMLGFSINSTEAKKVFAPFTKKEQAEVLFNLSQ